MFCSLTGDKMANGVKINNCFTTYFRSQSQFSPKYFNITNKNSPPPPPPPKYSHSKLDFVNRNLLFINITATTTFWKKNNLTMHNCFQIGCSFCLVSMYLILILRFEFRFKSGFICLHRSMHSVNPSIGYVSFFPSKTKILTTKCMNLQNCNSNSLNTLIQLQLHCSHGFHFYTVLTTPMTIIPIYSPPHPTPLPWTSPFPPKTIRCYIFLAIITSFIMKCPSILLK